MPRGNGGRKTGEASAAKDASAKDASAKDASDRARKRNQESQAQLDLVFAALAHPTRRQILLNLKIRGESMSSGDIAARYACAWPTVTRHLNVLKEAGLIVVKREGRSLQYCLNGDVLDQVAKGWFSHFKG